MPPLPLPHDSGYPKILFSHIQLFVDSVEQLSVYKKLEESLNEYHAKILEGTDANCRALWSSLRGGEEKLPTPFIPHGRDVIKQLIVGFGFRITGCRIPSNEIEANTETLLVTSRDPLGVQIIISADANNSTYAAEKDPFHHLDVVNIHQFLAYHGNRQGIAVLGFQTNDVTQIHERYQSRHASLIQSYNEYNSEAFCTKVLQVYAYYQSTSDAGKIKIPDKGTILRFIQTENNDQAFCVLPGLIPVDAVFDTNSQPAYSDHWVSNVFNRTECLNTLEDTLGFTPKVDFNAGVVAAGEAQIESTVTGNSSALETSDKVTALKDQSQVYLPINNALSSVGHVHGFLKEIGQGVQHIASRVENLVDFVDRCNKMREVTGEGFSFLKIPRSYYGILTTGYLASESSISENLASRIFEICVQSGAVGEDGAVSLSLDRERVEQILDIAMDAELRESVMQRKQDIVSAILKSRYSNLYLLLQHHISEELYMGIVRNQILVDVQGEDVLLQIFTANILQRTPAEEAPFFEFIQRVCSECKSANCSRTKIKPGCGGFGIRNFLTLFLSIEVGKAMRDAAEAKRAGDTARHMLATRQVECLTNQLNDSNPIMTEIAEAMTEEGACKEEMNSATQLGDNAAFAAWKDKMELASQRKQAANANLKACNSRYEGLMRSIRETSK